MAGGKSSDCPAGANMHHVGAHSQLMIERLAIVAWHSLAILRLKTQTIPWPDTLHVTVVACEACNFISRITWSHWLEGRHCVPSHSPKDKNMSYAEIAEISGQWQRGMKLPRHPSLEKHQKTHTDSNILQEFRKILGKSLENLEDSIWFELPSQAFQRRRFIWWLRCSGLCMSWESPRHTKALISLNLRFPGLFKDL